jgi:hypothetical protein
VNKNHIIFFVIACLICLIIALAIFTTLIVFKVFKTKRDILIDAFSKEYLIPRSMNMRNFAVMYLLEYGKLNLQRMDPFYEFYTYSEDKDFISQCKEIFQKLELETIDLMYAEFLDHLSQILTYRCYYHANPEAKRLAEKENLSLHEMDFDQYKDQQMIKNLFSIEYSDSELFQIALDGKLSKASKKTIVRLIDYL